MGSASLSEAPKRPDLGLSLEMSDVPDPVRGTRMVAKKSARGVLPHTSRSLNHYRRPRVTHKQRGRAPRDWGSGTGCLPRTSERSPGRDLTCCETLTSSRK